jgi:hypothetical protein
MTKIVKSARLRALLSQKYWTGASNRFADCGSRVPDKILTAARERQDCVWDANVESPSKKNNRRIHGIHGRGKYH